ncbi:MAG: hypothetical protein HDT28_00825 [Clostridiales bacterium]|nr:hypothetical protein [Clostridiales bacterium]
MMRTNKRIGIKYIIVTAILLIALLAAGMLFARGGSAVTADNNPTLTIHVYDPAQEYSKITGWVWIGNSSDERPFDAQPLEDEQFKKDDNVARAINIELTQREFEQLKNGTKLGFLVVVKKAETGGWDNKYDKESMGDCLVDLSDKFDANNHADVYFVRKDSDVYTNLEEAKMALEKIISAKFTNKTSIWFEASSAIRNGAKVTLTVNGDAVATANAKVNPETSEYKATALFPGLKFDFETNYRISVAGYPKDAAISKSTLIDTSEFITQFETAGTQDAVLGAVISADKKTTTFRLWAPLSTETTLNLYKDGSEETAYDVITMEKALVQGKWGGIWEAVIEENLNGTYYTYTVNNTGAPVETIDPYAKACGVNGDRGMVIDFSTANPTGWDKDKHLYATNATNADTPILWEVQVKDFSASPDSGMKYKGKFLAFTEQNTTVPGTDLKTGLNYLKDLGITYVHLNPVYDFATIDERETTNADNTKDNFNWGYDPQNYNIPEGSYSTDPTRGEVRINEFKQMVMALHQAGIGVVMDVVYNHTYQTQGQALHDTLPYYYHRTNKDGGFENGAGCGNETASERTMVRKYIVDSVKFWAEEYHIDGFRFDLMGLHDVATIQAVRDALDTIDGGKGKQLLVYGEPWSADGSYTPYSWTTRKNATSSASTKIGKYMNNSNNNLIKHLFAGFSNDYPRSMDKLPERVAVFNDTGRDGMRGNVWDGVTGKGWVNGTKGEVSSVQRLLEGGAGTSGSGMYTGSGAKCIAYAAAHDNYTLWDQLVGSRHGETTPVQYDIADATRIKQCKLISAAYLMSAGVPFMLAGEEMGRTKYGNENSYNSPYKLNMINWSRQEAFSDLYNHFKKLIAARKQYSSQLFSYSKSINPNFCYATRNEGDGSTGALHFERGTTTKLELDLNPSTWQCSVKIGGKSVL